jgi:hypothetical protein
MDRRDELLIPIDALLAVHQEWQTSDNPELSRELMGAIEDALAVWSGGDMPGDLLDMYSRMQGLAEAWTETVMRADDPDHIRMDQAKTFWTALDGIRQLRQKSAERDIRDYRPLESVAVLTKQNVSDEQICRIYRAEWQEGAKTGPGLWDWRRNRPMLEELEKERANPGSVIPTDFVPWHVARKAREAKHRQAAAERAKQARLDRIAKMHQPCPETLKELINQGVDIEQIARMKKTTPSEIRKQCVAEGLPMPKEPEALRSDYDPKPNEAQERIEQAQANRHAQTKEQPVPEPSGFEDADDDWDGIPADIEEDAEPISDNERLVAKWMDTGGKPKEIAAAIESEGGPKLTAREVSAIMGRLKGDEARMKAATVA